MRAAGLRTPVLGLLGAVVALGLVACGADDRNMAKPSPSQTTTTSIRGTTPSSAAGVGVGTVGTAGAVGTQAKAFELTTTAFTPGGTIPERYTCKGMGARPDLAWSNVPAGTAELAIVVDDPDANGFVHWVVSGLAPTSTGIPEGELPATAIEAENGLGKQGWSGPCPPAGSGVHHYQFQLVALAKPLGLDPSLSGTAAAQQVLQAHSLGTALLTGSVDGG
jgi:Raf kinase inhibitor-like YbhB/YbcL family protein